MKMIPDTFDPDTKKDFVKEAIALALELVEKDVVVFSKDRVIVRLFQARERPMEAAEGQEVFEDDNTQVEGAEKIAGVLAGYDQETLEYLISLVKYPLAFEREVLKSNEGDDGAKVFVTRAFRQVINSEKHRKHLNFLHLASYDDFNLKWLLVGLQEELSKTIEAFMVSECGLSEEEAAAVLATREAKVHLLQMGQKYLKRFAGAYRELIANTFFELVGRAESIKQISAVVQDAINGNNRYVSIFKQGTSRIASKPDQVWMRVRQAKLERDKANRELIEEVDKLSKQVSGLEKNIQAISRAKQFSMAQIGRYKHEDLRDIVVNEEGERNEEKRLLQFLPSGPLTMHLAELAHKGLISATNDIAKEEYKRTEKFFNNLHSNNTPKALEMKLLSLSEEFPKRKGYLQRLQEQLDEARSQGLEAFDEALAKMKKAILLNLGVAA